MHGTLSAYVSCTVRTVLQSARRLDYGSFQRSCCYSSTSCSITTSDTALESLKCALIIYILGIQKGVVVAARYGRILKLAVEIGPTLKLVVTTTVRPIALAISSDDSVSFVLRLEGVVGAVGLLPWCPYHAAFGGP